MNEIIVISAQLGLFLFRHLGSLGENFLVNNCDIFDSFCNYSYAYVFKSFSERIIHILKFLSKLLVK